MGLLFAAAGFAVLFALWVILPKFLQSRANAE